MATQLPSRIRFEAVLHGLDSSSILRLPEEASRRLPSRGQVAVHGSINDHPFRTVLEPDGSFGHWMKVDKPLQKAAGLKPGKTARLELEPVKEWPEPHVPNDLGAALATAPQKVQLLWHDITPTARWEWVRWVNATRTPQTRQGRVEVTLSKLSSGKRRPCCFNLSACTDPDLARNGKLVMPP